MIPARRLEPEWLDQLPATDPGAMHTRRDLRRINALLRHPAIMTQALIRHAPPAGPRTLLDLGCGDGAFMLGLARRLASRWPNVSVMLLDRQDIVKNEIREALMALTWKVETIAADVFDFLATEQSRADIVTANLFLHQFTEEQLAGLFTRVARSTQLFVSCDPRRATWVREMSRLLWVIGCNRISIHDAVVSARAGFDGTELSVLWPAGREWRLHEHPAWPFTHCFLAQRTGTH